MKSVWIIYAILAKVINAYIYVVPQSACMDMMPQHNASVQKSIAPYTIFTDRLYFDSYERVKGESIGLIVWSDKIIRQ
jgi:hypothetical protein